jgi:hypothetical protein
MKKGRYRPVILECETNPVSRGEKKQEDFGRFLGREGMRGSERNNNADAHDFCMRMR